MEETFRADEVIAIKQARKESGLPLIGWLINAYGTKAVLEAAEKDKDIHNMLMEAITKNETHT